MSFPTTSWTQIRDLQQLSGEKRRELLDQWVQRYWKPVYAYFRAKRQSPEQAADLVQGFFCCFLEADKIMRVEQTEARFRAWLRSLARRYLVDRIRSGEARKRKPAAGIVSFEALRRQDGEPFEPAATDIPKAAFLDTWRRDLVDRALQAVREECVLCDRLADYEIFERYYVRPLTDEQQPRWQDLAAEYKLPAVETAERKASWVKSRLARALWRSVRRYVESDSAADDEIRELLG